MKKKCVPTVDYLNFVVRSQRSWPLAAGCMISIHSILAVLCSCLLLCWLSGSGQSPEVCWSGSVLGFHGFQLAISWYHLREIPGVPVHLHSATAYLARSLWAFDTWSFEQHNFTYLSHWLACISFKQDDNIAENVLQLEIKLCNIQEFPCRNCRLFKSFGKRSAKKFGMPNFQTIYNRIVMHTSVLWTAYLVP